MLVRLTNTTSGVAVSCASKSIACNALGWGAAIIATPVRVAVNSSFAPAGVLVSKNLIAGPCAISIPRASNPMRNPCKDWFDDVNNVFNPFAGPLGVAPNIEGSIIPFGQAAITSHGWPPSSLIMEIWSPASIGTKIAPHPSMT